VELSISQFQLLLDSWGQQSLGAIVLHSIVPETSPVSVDKNGSVCLIQQTAPQGIRVLSVARLPRNLDLANGYSRGSWGELELGGKLVHEWQLAAAGLSLGYASAQTRQPVGGVAEFGVVAGQLFQSKTKYAQVGASQLGCYAHNRDQMSGVPDLTVWLNTVTQPVTIKPEYPGVSAIQFQAPKGYEHRFGVLLSPQATLTPIAHKAHPQIEWLSALMNIRVAMSGNPDLALRNIEKLPEAIQANRPLGAR
jgi:hypothetical protein